MMLAAIKAGGKGRMDFDRWVKWLLLLIIAFTVSEWLWHRVIEGIIEPRLTKK